MERLAAAISEVRLPIGILLFHQHTLGMLSLLEMQLLYLEEIITGSLLGSLIFSIY